MSAPATFSSRCHCGAIVRTACPTLFDTPAAMDAIEAQGWRWYDGIGFACSPECAVAREEELALLQLRASRWPRGTSVKALPQLFAEAAA